jgi:hypothetical protein
MGKLAALSSGLLARKGQARPAMRPQGYAGYISPADDLGWNDMGQGAAQPMTPVPVVAETEVSAELPPVLAQREALAREVEQPAEAPVMAEAPAEPIARKQVSVATATRIRKETAEVHKKGNKSAFTLRLDGERHLRLRLASAIADRSSQALMTDALDAFLHSIPEVEALVAALPPAKRR